MKTLFNWGEISRTLTKTETTPGNRCNVTQNYSEGMHLEKVKRVKRIDKLLREYLKS